MFGVLYASSMTSKGVFCSLHAVWHEDWEFHVMEIIYGDHQY
jgi:hypothetical protein